MIIPNKEIKERAVGCFVGLAMGDALGAAIEFKTAMQIRNRFS